MKLKNIIKPKPHEDILLLLRPAFSARMVRLLGPAFWFVLPFFFLYPLIRLGTWGLVIFGVVVLAGAFVFARAFFEWTHTLFVVTDHRIIDIDQRGWTDRTVTDASFDQIDEVYFRMKGLWGLIFGYGTVFIRMKGEAADLKWMHVKRPARAQDLIRDLMDFSHEKK